MVSMIIKSLEARSIFDRFILRQGRRIVISLPMIWGALFLLIPLIIVIKISLAKSVIGRPPYTALYEIVDSYRFILNLDFSNYFFLLKDGLSTDNIYIQAYLNSLNIAFFSTILCLVIGYPIAYYIARSSLAKRNLLLMLVILPFWTSFLLRIYAWIGMLNNTGMINSVLLWLGVISEPIAMMQTTFAVYIGIVYAYLPFMILPLYANLVKLDGRLLEASADLGARPIVTFFTVTFWHSLPGIIAGCALVFIPVIGEFVIPELLGGANTIMIGRQLWNEFFANRDWPVASAVATVMLLIIIFPIVFLQSKNVSASGPKI
ncbi:MAG: ABC transporter permease subunit [Methylacidiphilales bacterium]|nr:ABC transporter permease subunit [Candidatus Methylacidiphilales bacterium]